MHRLISISALALAVSACSPDTSEDTPVADPATETPAPEASDSALLYPLPTDTTPAIAADDLGVRIAALADDVFEGRGPGTEAGEAAADWVAAEMERVGLQPGANGSWFQTVEMVTQTLDQEQSSLTISSSPDAAPFEIGSDAVFWTKHQTELDLSFDASEVVFVGYGAVAPEYGWDDYAGLNVEGKTVIILVNDPGYATQDPDLFNGNAMTYYGRWTYKFEEAARQGATAAIVVHQTAPAAYGWDVVRNSWTGGQPDLVRSNGGEDRALLEGWVTEDVAMALFEEAGLDFAALTAAAAEPGFEPVPMDGLMASGRIVQTVDYAESRNVIGMIEGTETPDEFMMFTAHWDHLGNAADPTDPNFSFASEDTIYNGAVDNATGTSALLEIAEAMVAEAPARSVLFAAVTLEESGLLGSAYMAANPIIPSNQIVAGINMDGMLPTPPTHDMIVVGYGASELEGMLEDILAADDRVVVPDPLPQNGYFYRSDHISYAKLGIPMLYSDGGDNLIEGGRPAGQAEAADYTAFRYHKPQDEYSEDWNLDGMEQNITALYTLGLEIAQSDLWPTWYEGNEFEAIRQADLASASGAE
ncbi:M28 family metallopeptidase [Ponticaulis sp.]|uniref:M28 family metallopeptidase n=1 Tax=Ponticaulis sp. TaxID=2020902 RepID=UPI000B735352|nr:M28 family metallopeptidase [Ponticaulis sp.]MAI89618.1 peptidase M28 [Ponticaulis sp.]OUY00643.1 MAG: peptidase M28 [Hyphomonadaceae bacterium TMED5]|tara:strand:- start:174344 stop:176107 length:1764 start_codon:yes stop_codon:yes gene_type:complete